MKNLSNEQLLEKYEELLSEIENGFQRNFSDVAKDLDECKEEILSRMVK